MGFSVSTPSLLILAVTLAMAFSHWAPTPVGAAYNVSYDSRSLIIDGHRKLLISASIHYPLSVPAMWPGLVQLAKEGGVDVIESYVFWNGHELSPDNVG